MNGAGGAPSTVRFPSQQVLLDACRASACARCRVRARPSRLADRVERRRQEVVGRERLAGHEVHDGRLHARNRARQRQHATLTPKHAGCAAHDVAQRRHVRTAQLERLPGHVAPVDARDERLGDVADVDRRELARRRTRAAARPASACRMRGEFVDEGVARPEHDRRLEDHELRLASPRIRAGCSPPPAPLVCR